MTNSLLLKMAIEIVDFPINSMVIFHSYVSLPEGKSFGKPCQTTKIRLAAVINKLNWIAGSSDP